MENIAGVSSLAKAGSVAILLGACAVGPQSSAVSEMRGDGFVLAGGPAPSDAPQALTYSGEVDGRVACFDGNDRVRLTDSEQASEMFPDHTVRQNSTLDIYAIVNPDGTRNSSYVLTFVREVWRDETIVAREILTAAFENDESGRLGNLAECSAA